MILILLSSIKLAISYNRNPLLAVLGSNDSKTSKSVVASDADENLVYIQFSKVGSSSFRSCFYVWEQLKPGGKYFQKKVAVHQARYGLCKESELKSCRYVVVLRDPIQRSISSWEYFCKQCEEGNRFCHNINEDIMSRYDITLHWPNKNGTASPRCPRMDLPLWTAAWGNMYTMDLSGKAFDYMKEYSNITSRQWIHHYSRWIFDIREWFPKVADRLSYEANEATLEAAKQKIISGEVIPLIIEDMDDEIWQSYASDISGINAKILADKCKTIEKNKGKKLHNRSEDINTQPMVLNKLRDMLKYDIELYNFAKQHMRDKWKKNVNMTK